MDRLLLGFVPAASSQEKQSAFAATIGWFAKMLGEIKRGVIRFPFVLECYALPFHCNPRNVFLVEQFGREEMRMLRISAGLANQMIDLRRSNPCDLVLDCASSTRTNRQFSFTVQRQQSASAFDLHFARKRRHP